MEPLSAPGRVRHAPTPEQQQAADPAVSAWVTASAGTGKTRVLADRVLRLLLAGVHPEQILCLTFTKAGATEMVRRIQDDLGRYAVLAAAELALELGRLLGRPALPAERARAATLFAQVLDLPAGLRIMTIHSFCQSLLRRFPLEAGVVPHFEVLEGRAGGELQALAQDEVLARALARQAELRAAIETLAVGLADATLHEALAEVCQQRLRLRRVVAALGGLDAALERLHAVLDCAPDATPQSLRRALAAEGAFDRAGLAMACRALAGGKRTDQDRAAVIAAWLAADERSRRETYGDYERAYLTAKGGALAKLATKDVVAVAPAALDALLAEQARVAAGALQQKRLASALQTRALLQLGWALVDAYEQRKDQQAALDYDDLIDRSRALLQQPDVALWVRYKLDQQIDHLLVDEAQDTSPDQWAVIAALVEDFFAGESARGVARSLFVVGDEKQSIFSFQGADLANFQAMREQLGARAQAGGSAWHEAPLTRSFRSAAPVLAVVDQVFAEAPARDGVVTGPAPLAHRCARENAPGSVEVWPLVERPAGSDAEDWQFPDRQPEAAETPEKALAAKIAATIFDWRRDAIQLPGSGRPIAPGDIMILLPRRGILQELLIAALKRRSIPVAGRDRLRLAEDIAVMDLMALGDAVLLPEDDLNFAALLKSPLLGVSEEQLFDLAHGRGEAHLFERLAAAAARDPALAVVQARFQDAQRRADFAPPFEFFARILGEGGGRARLLARLGEAAREPIEAFLAQALAYERRHPPSLQGFLHWLRQDEGDIRRDPDQPRDEVRILTIHGAKGLEAPIVFLTDTTYQPDIRDRLLWDGPADPPLWRAARAQREPLGEARCAAAKARREQEQRRLLYVAMTRARDHLIVTGWERSRSTEGSWYGLIDAARPRLAGVEALPGGGWRYANFPDWQRAAHLAGLAAEPATPALPAWLHRAAPSEPVRPSRRPTDLEALASPASPLAAHDAGHRQRGRLIHRLLQSLPQQPRATHLALIARYLDQAGADLAPAARDEIAALVLRIIDAPAFAAAFAPGSRAEVPLAGLLEGELVVGRVDRLAVSAAGVLVVDYKTDRRPPADAAALPLPYRRQMAIYRALLRQIYPGRDVRCALLWTETAQLMPLAAALLDASLPCAREA